jgi:hypothetical protein
VGEQKCNCKREVDGFVYSQESADGCASKQCGEANHIPFSSEAEVFPAATIAAGAKTNFD